MVRWNDACGKGLKSSTFIKKKKYIYIGRTVIILLKRTLYFPFLKKTLVVQASTHTHTHTLSETTPLIYAPIHINFRYVLYLRRVECQDGMGHHSHNSYLESLD